MERCILDHCSHGTDFSHHIVDDLEREYSNIPFLFGEVFQVVSVGKENGIEIRFFGKTVYSDIFECSTYINDKREGISLLYMNSDLIITQFKNGLRDGKMNSYVNGVLKSSVSYECNIYHGQYMSDYGKKIGVYDYGKKVSGNWAFEWC